jgi:hypothetical protein
MATEAIIKLIVFLVIGVPILLTFITIAIYGVYMLWLNCCKLIWLLITGKGEI